MIKFILLSSSYETFIVKGVITNRRVLVDEKINDLISRGAKIRNINFSTTIDGDNDIIHHALVEYEVQND